jgi:hypothetical protein
MWVRFLAMGHKREWKEEERHASCHCVLFHDVNTLVKTADPNK